MKKTTGAGMLALLAAAFLAGSAQGASVYVVPTNAAAAEPYDTWAKAATSIQAAVDYASDHIETHNTVTVSNGTYNISATITINAGITVRSFGNGVYGGLANASNTIVQNASGTTRVFSNGNANAVIAGLTIRNGSGKWVTGCGIYMTGGLVQDCIIKENGLLGDTSFIYGGGVYMTGGTVLNCIFQSNKSGPGGGTGGGIYATGGQILFCRILGNTGASSGGGIYASSASVLIRNCLIAANSCGGGGGGVWGGTIENCTIVNNNASGGGSSGGGVYGSAVINSIVLKNRTGSGILSVADYSGSTFSYSCATPKPSGVGNVDFAAFVNFGAGDYRLMACPAVDAGMNLAWMAGALDLAGNPRTNGVNNRVDMGAYELIPGALQCGLAADVTSVTAPSKVVFTSYLAGTNRNVTSYRWDFGDGHTTNGATLAVVTKRYTAAGSYTVKLTVANDASESFTATNAGYMTVWGTNAYVWTNSPFPGAPYHTWANAARTIGDAVAAAPAGTDVVVTNNSTYTISVQILLDKAIFVRSFGNGVYGGLGNASNTIVKGSASRIFNITAAGAVIAGLTIRDGAPGQGVNGHGVNMTGGLVRDCIVRNNGILGGDSGEGVAVYMTGGTVSNCIITANKTKAGGQSVVRGEGGLITHCLIVDNIDQVDKGGGVYLNGATLRNCLIARNVENGGSGGGVYLNAGAIENCTIISNTATANAGGVYRVAGTVSNSIVYFNTVGGVHSNLNTTDGLYYSCFINPGTTANGNIDADPLFVNPTVGDYRLQFSPIKSPCIDTGANAAWMEMAKDLDGKPRLLQNAVDRGVFECWPVAPQLQNGGVSNITDRSAALRGKITWPGSAPITLFLFHGPEDGGTNRSAWANEIRFPGARSVGFHEAAIAHAASNRVWFYRCYATNLYGAVWADSTASFINGLVEVKVTKRESTEEKPAEFVITRPATAISVPLEVNFTLGGIGVNGTDYEQLDSPVVIPPGKTEVRLRVNPKFNFGDQRPKSVELTLAPGGYTLGVNRSARILTRNE